MSEAKINKILSKADAKAGKLLGRMFSVYRPVAWDNSFAPQNFIKDQHAAFTLSAKFTDPEPEKYRHYVLYTNRTGVQAGDIFADAGDTYVVVSARPIENMIAIRADDLVKVERVAWSNVNGLQAVGTVVARNIPASVIGVSSSATQGVPNVDKSAQAPRWELRIYATKAQINPTDNIRLSDNTLLRVDQVTITDHFQLLTCTKVKE